MWLAWLQKPEKLEAVWLKRSLIEIISVIQKSNTIISSRLKRERERNSVAAGLSYLSYEMSII